MITYHSFTYTDGTSGNITIDKPTGVAIGDLLVAVIGGDDVLSNVPTISGFTSMGGYDGLGVSPASNNSTRVMYRKATSDDVSASSYTVTWGGGNRFGAMLRFSGVATDNQFKTHQANISGLSNPQTFTVSSSTITPDFADSLFIFVGSSSADSNGITSMAMATNNPTWTEVVYDQTVGSQFRNIRIEYAIRSQVTATGNFTYSADRLSPGSTTVNYGGAVAMFNPIVNVSLNVPKATLELEGLNPEVKIDTIISIPTATLELSTPNPEISTTDRNIWTNDTKPSSNWTNEIK